MFNVIDLFCGCGGLSLGFHNSGYNIIGAFDNWEVAVKTYNEICFLSLFNILRTGHLNLDYIII